ncbi:hypothetical protein C8R45DRAFT_1220700 [Mycena sanguinolenta]|nr:hypothetical protein C8R45DRAFT_1220700 [Mycena sanguinolenta]
MGDTLCSGLVYLCTCCCFCSSSDPGSDGSGFCSGSGKRKSKDRDPREKALKQEFMQRGYHRDAVSGRIHVDQPIQSHLMMAAIGQPPRPSSESMKHPSGEQPSHGQASTNPSPLSGEPP